MTADVPNRIAEAMEELMKIKSSDKLTVRDLTNACGISRQTFYYYFDDIDGVMDLMRDRGLRRALKKCAKAQTIEEAIEIYLTDFLEFSDRIRRGLESADRHEKLILSSARLFVRELLTRYPGASGLGVEESAMLTHFFACGLMGTVASVSQGAQLDVGAVSRCMANLLRGRRLRRQQGDA